MNPIAEVKDLWYAYPALEGESPPWVLQGVDLRLAAGELVCLMGPSGAGKSTLALALNGIVPQSTGGRIRGQVMVEGLDTKRTPVAELAKRVGIVFQDPETQFLQANLEAEVAFGLENLGVPADQIRDRVREALTQVELDGFEARSPFELSGGEKQRAAIASVLAMRPKLLVLDEPTASLDPMGKLQVFEAIQDLRREHTVLVVTQESEWAAEFADRVVVLDGGRLSMYGETAAILSDVERLEQHGLRGPQVSELAHCLNQRAGQDSYRFTRLKEAIQRLAPVRAA